MLRMLCYINNMEEYRKPQHLVSNFLIFDSQTVSGLYSESSVI